MRIFVMSLIGATLTLSASSYLAKMLCNTRESVLLAPFIGVPLLAVWVFAMVKADMYFNAE